MARLYRTRRSIANAIGVYVIYEGFGSEGVPQSPVTRRLDATLVASRRLKRIVDVLIRTEKRIR